jgi:hypothetical protein
MDRWRLYFVLTLLVISVLVFAGIGLYASKGPTATPEVSATESIPSSATPVQSTPSASPIVTGIPFATTDNIAGPPRGSVSVAIAFARSHGSVRLPEVERYIREIYSQAPAVGFDPALLVAQSALETGNWTSYWWAQRLNPAGLGITGHPLQEASSPQFGNGTTAARAHLAHMHAEVRGKSEPLPAVLEGKDPTYSRVFDAGWAGSVRTLEDLSGTWAVDPDYAAKIVDRAREIFGEG